MDIVVILLAFIAVMTFRIYSVLDDILEVLKKQQKAIDASLEARDRRVP